MYLLTLNPALFKPKDNASDIPYSCANSMVPFFLLILSSLAFLDASLPKIYNSPVSNPFTKKNNPTWSVSGRVR